MEILNVWDIKSDLKGIDPYFKGSKFIMHSDYSRSVCMADYYIALHGYLGYIKP